MQGLWGSRETVINDGDGAAQISPQDPQDRTIIVSPGAFMAPWPHQPCPHPDCGQQLRDLLAEMVANADQRTPEFRALIGQPPGGAITLRYSRTKMELRARDDGSQKNPPDIAMTPEQWVAEEKLMAGALREYNYVEDGTP